MLCKWKRSVCACALLGVAFILTLDVSASTIPIFWIEFDGPVPRIGRLQSDGSGYQVLVNSAPACTGIEVDPFNGQIYFVQGSGAARKISKVSTLGGAVTDVITGLPNVADIALDYSAGKLYWSNSDIPSNINSTFPTIQRANLNGSNLETLAMGARSTHLDLDTNAGKVYWTADVNVLRADLTGANQQTILTDNSVYEFTGIAVGYDSTYYPGGRVYVGSYDINGGLLRSLPLAGGVAQNIATIGYPVYGIDFHPGYGRVAMSEYFNNSASAGLISWIKADGSGYQQLTAMATNTSAVDVAVWPFFPEVPEPGTLTLTAVAVVLFIAHGGKQRCYDKRG